MFDVEPGNLLAINPFVSAENARLKLGTCNVLARLTETYSQNAEDTIVVSLLSAIATTRSPVKDATYLDIGANHPVQLNNSYALHRRFGIRGTLIEPDESRLEDLRRVREGDRVIHAAVTKSRADKVTLYRTENSEFSSTDERHAVRFNQIRTTAAEVPNIYAGSLHELVEPGYDVFLLSIDTEGVDIDILRAINWDALRPWIVVSEPYEAGGNEQIAHDMVATMRERDYHPIAMTPCNLIFIDRRWLK